MAQKKTIPKKTSKKSSKTKNLSKKNPVAPKGKKKKSKSAKTSVKPKTTKGVKKKKPASKVTPGKKTVASKKAVSKKKKTTSKKKVVKSVPKVKAKKATTKKPLALKKKTPVATKKVKPSQKKKPVLRATKSSSAGSHRVSQPKADQLSPTERYNIGGLFMCAIERALDPGSRRLRSVFRHLQLTSMEEENLLRLSQGFMIPKLFADSLASEKVGPVLTDLVKYALSAGDYEKKWCNEIRQVGLWLGFFPEQVEKIEQQVKR